MIAGTLYCICFYEDSWTCHKGINIAGDGKVIPRAGLFVLMKPSRGENVAREGFCPDIDVRQCQDTILIIGGNQP